MASVRLVTSSASAMSELFRDWEPLGEACAGEAAEGEAERTWGVGSTRVVGPALGFEPGPGPGSGAPERVEFELGGWEGEAVSIGETVSAGGERPAAERGEFPRPGEVLNRFRLLSELGRGAYARVYLAEEIDLGDRLVALKVSPPGKEEPQNLSRLQHTHIMPIHSLHQDPETGWQLICMPYLGGADLAKVLRKAGGRAGEDRITGRSLLEALDWLGQEKEISGSVRDAGGAGGSTGGVCRERSEAGARFSVVRSAVGRILGGLPGWEHRGEAGDGVANGRDAPRKGSAGVVEPARRYLQSATNVQAAMWVVARLAEGLAHAHERGVLHRDLKPSNILIASDGTPMLLDFNLSVGVSRNEAGPLIGGTVMYMAPEHLEALLSQGRGEGLAAVGPAADIYALGLILFEMVADRLPFDAPPKMSRLADAVAWMITQRRGKLPSARAWNPAVPWGLESIVRRCLEPRPSRRYATAGELAEDLQRVLDDRPLRFAPELSVREVMAKWWRRHPGLCNSMSVGVLAAAVLLGMAVTASGLRAHLEESQARLEFQAFQTVYREAQLQLNMASAPGESLARGIERATQALERYGVGTDRAWMERPAVASLSAHHRQRLLEELSELIQLRARAVARDAQRWQISELERRQAYVSSISWLNLAEAIDPAPSYTLYDDRARYWGALGEAGAAARDRALRDAHPPRGVRDLSLLGSSLLAAGELDPAEQVLLRVVTMDPRHFWAWFTLGLCYLEQGRPLDAAGAFATATVIEPRSSWAHLNRGLALARAGRLMGARLAQDRAVDLAPQWAAARLHRAMTALELGDLATAYTDLNRAVGLGNREPGVLLARAETLARLGRRAEAEAALARLVRDCPDDPRYLVARGFFQMGVNAEAARGDFEAVLRERPNEPRALLGRAHVNRQSDPMAALADLDRALRVDPELWDAIELRALVRGRTGQVDCLSDVAKLEKSPTGQRLYNAACALALLSRARGDLAVEDRAVELLARARARGFSLAGAAADPDLETLRDHAGFLSLCREAAGRARRLRQGLGAN